MSIAPGTRLASYEVLSPLGAGGMGEVYRARDTKLGRDVAIKVLPDSFALDPDRVARFTREAKALASLNHPGIGAIYGVEEQGSTRALVMELVEGEDLSQVIARGPIPVAEALAIARQIADALEAAHGAGIVHRDLKPANIKVKADGAVKVLDFGLAKSTDASDSSGSLANSPTLTARATQMGVILGTAAYMSPEQARGRVVDRRADIWALGVILYEMLCGRRAFAGDDISITIASVLKDDIDWTAMPSSAPRALVRLLRRCLAKDPKARLRDAGDVRLEIDDILSGAAAEPAGGSPTPASRRSVTWIAGMVVGLMAIATAAATLAWRLKPAASDVPLRKFSIAGKGGASIFNAVISPDGRSIAFLVGGKLWVRRLDALDAQEIPGAADVNSLFWSSDSAMVGFQAKGQLWKVTATGGQTAPIARVPREFSNAGGAIWLPDNRIVFTTGGSGLMDVSALGGEPRVLLAPDAKTETDFHNVSALPDGKGVLFVPHPVNRPMNTVDIFDGTTRRTLFTIADEGPLAFPVYSPSGHLVYISGASVWAVPFALDRQATTGAPFRIAATGGRPSMAADGTLAMITGASGEENMEPAWVNAKGDAFETVGRKGHPLMGLRLSPDGRHAAGSAFTAPGMSDIWIIDLARRTERRLTYEPGINTGPVWSRDNRHVVYACASGICSRPADGSGQPLALVPAPAARPELSPDNKTLLFAREQAVTGLDVFQVPLGPAGAAAPPVEQPRPFVANERSQFVAEVSPSGQHAAYWSTESGPAMIYITEFPSGRGKWQVGQGQMPRWSPKGDRLYYNLGDNIAVVDVTTTPALTLSEPRTVLPATAGVQVTGFGFDLSRDGSRFLVNRLAGLGSAASVTVVQNWFAEFAGRGKPQS